MRLTQEGLNYIKSDKISMVVLKVGLAKDLDKANFM